MDSSLRASCKGKASAGFFHLHADFQKQRLAGFQEIFETSKTFGEGQEFLHAGHVLQGEDGPARAFLGAHGASANDKARDGDFLAVALAFDFIERNDAEFFQARRVFFQRMAGNVKPEHGIFAGEAIFFGPGGASRSSKWTFGSAGAAAEEEAVLAGFLGARGTLDSGDGIVDRGGHGFAGAERIHGAAT